jgi:TonB family protein
MTLTSFAAEYALRLIALVAVVGIGLALARPALARTRLFVWTLVLSAAWLMPLAVAFMPDVEIPLLAVFSTPEVVLTGAAAAADEVAAMAPPPSAASSSFTFERLAWLGGAAYLMGVALLLLRMAWGWHLTHRLISSAREIPDADLRGLVSQFGSELGIRVAPLVLESPLVHVPFACGVWRPRLVLPAVWRTWDEATLHAVLVHELAHIARRDVTTMRAAALYRALTWVNPASWWLRRRLESLAEAASDEAVLATGADRAAYAEILLGFMATGPRATGRAAWHLAMARPGAADAERRITNVLEWRGGGPMGLTSSKKCAIAAVVVVAGLPAMVLTAGQTDAPIVVSAPVITPVSEQQQQQQSGAPGRGTVTFDFVMPVAGAPASIVSMTMSVEPGEFVRVKVQNSGARPIRRVTLQARVASVEAPTTKPRVFNSAPLATLIAPGDTVELNSGLLDTRSASRLATGGPVRATFSVLHVEFTDGEVWPPVRDPVVTPRAEDDPAQQPYEIGSPGVLVPKLLRQSHPKYTPEGLRAKIEGVVELRVVVGVDGTVKDAEVTRSLDTAHGLDQQAIAAAREWVFSPATLNGKAVPMTVVLQMEFRVH